jgi:DNA polymerase-3 subunit gamma/tau
MENNIALYRKYRPGSFSEVVGQEHIVQTLINSLNSGSISHAYLFSGPRGSGKTTMARIFAKAVNCEAKKDKPCNECDSCKEIAAQKSLDLIEIDAASHTGVDEVRELIDGLKFAPVKSKYKVFIIDECHQLSKSASNALLKTLEEPPAHAIFILATTEAHKMLPTIISRCQRYDFKRLHVPELIKKLEFIAKQEEVKFEEGALQLIALNARGSFRDAESLLDKCMQFSGKSTISTRQIEELLGIVEVGKISKFVDLLQQKNAKEAVMFLNELVDGGIDLVEFAKTLIFYLRQMMLLKITPDFSPVLNSGLSKEEIAAMKGQLEKMTEKEIQGWLERFIEAENKMKFAIILQLPLELAVVDITQK